MIVTVTAHPARDITVSLPVLVSGETNRSGAVAERAGGKGINVARVIAALGHPVAAIAPLDSPGREWFDRELAGTGVDMRAVPVGSALRTTIAVHESGSSRTTLIAGSGAALGPRDAAALVSAAESALAGARCLVVSGSVPPGTAPGLYGALVAAALAAGVPAIVDASGPALLEAAEAGATALKPNRQELLDATGGTDPLTAARALLALGTESVFVSLGADGMLCVTRGGEPLQVRLPEALPGNATGAGDAAVAAIAIALASGVTDRAHILRSAVALSASAVGMPLAGEVSPASEGFARQLVIEAVAR